MQKYVLVGELLGRKFYYDGEFHYVPTVRCGVTEPAKAHVS